MKPMSCAIRMLLFALMLPGAHTMRGRMTTAEEPDEPGRILVGDAPFPNPGGVREFPLPGGTFEDADVRVPDGWTARDGQVVTAPDAPQGRAYLRFKAAPGTVLKRGGIELADNAPHLISMWLRTDVPFEGLITLGDADVLYGRHIRLRFPATGGAWKRVGYLFRNLPGGRDGTLLLRLPAGTEEGNADIDDITLRAATEEEFTRAWNAWRSRYPARDLSARPGDGRHLALTAAKLGAGFDPPRPFLIWAVGSSYTNMLGDGETLRQHIRRTFPGCPDIVYKKHVGSAVPWQYVRGWVNHIVIPEQPDLVLIYTLGKPEDLAAILKDLRTGTTADIIVPSIHWRMRDVKNWDISEDAVDQAVQELRDVCAQFGAEFVENRREWADYLKAHGMTVEIDAASGLLKDAVHQSDYGALVINENIARHIRPNPDAAYRTTDRERRVPAKPLPGTEDGETTRLHGNWTENADSSLTTRQSGATLTVSFRGNRIDIIAATTPDGGSLDVLVDGTPASETPAFYASYIACGPGNARPRRGLVADRSPHGIWLGKNIVPQEWTIRMIDDNGNYELTGSVTGHDGRGNCMEPFTSRSGQVVVDPALWRRAKEPRSDVFNNRNGDVFTFQVYRAATPELSLKSSAPGKTRVTLAGNLANEPHTVTVSARGDGPVTVFAFDVFQPPMQH